METNFIVSLIMLNLFSCYLCDSFNYITLNTTNINLNGSNVTLSPELQKDYDYMIAINERKYRFACLFQIRNFLSNGAKNETMLSEVYSVLRSTKLNKTLSFNKIISMMALNCKKELIKEVYEEILIPERTLLLHPNYTTFLYFDKDYFNSSKEITFSNEEILYLKEIFSEYDSNNNNEQKIVHLEEKQRKFSEELSQLITNDYFIFGMAITKPYVLKYIGLGFGVTTSFIFLITWLVCSCLFKEKEEEEIKEINNKKKNY